MSSRASFRRLGLLAFVAGGALLAFIQSALLQDSLWHDEVYLSSVFLGDRVSLLCTSLMRDHFPSYYFQQGAWIACFGDSERSMRALPVLASWLLPVVLWKLCAAFLDRGQRLLLIGLVVFNPVYLYFSTEARSYLPTVFYLAAAAHLYFNSKRAAALPAYAAAMALSVFSHPYVIACLAPFLLHGVRARRTAYTAVNLTLIVLWGALVSFKLRAVGIPDDMAYLERLSPGRFIETFFSWFVHGYSLVSGGAALKTVYAALFLFGSIQLATSGVLPGLKKTLLFLAVAPVALLISLSIAIPYSFVERAVIYGYPFFWIAIVFGLSQTKGRVLRRMLAVFLAAVAALSVFAFLCEREAFPTVASAKNDWRGVTGFLVRKGAFARPEACVLSDIPLVGIRYYLKRRGMAFGDPVGTQRRILKETLARSGVRRALFAKVLADPPQGGGEPSIFQVGDAESLKRVVSAHRDFYLIRDPVRSRNFLKIQNELAALDGIDYDRTYSFKGVDVGVFHKKSAIRT